jgi:hypothetical protein
MSMKKTVLTFGLISGVVSSAMMVAFVPFIDDMGFDRGLMVGYTAIVLSFLLVFFGIRSYREQSGGHLTFGRGFTVGILISLISCVFYVITWEIIYFKFQPDFLEKFAAHEVERAQASGATEEKVEATRREMADFKEKYDNPFFNAAITFTEPFPVGLLVTTVSAAVLRTKRRALPDSGQPARQGAS